MPVDKAGQRGASDPDAILSLLSDLDPSGARTENDLADQVLALPQAGRSEGGQSGSSSVSREPVY